MFDLTGKLPKDAAVTSASLELSESWINKDAAVNGTLNKISRSWTPGSVTWKNFTPQNSTSKVVLNLKFQGSVGNWDKFDITSVVKEWQAAPATNFGVLFDKSSGDDLSWVSEKSSLTSRRPKLVINYSGTAIVSNSKHLQSAIQITNKRCGIEIRNNGSMPVRHTVTDLKGRTLKSIIVQGKSTRALELVSGTYLVQSWGVPGKNTRIVHIN